MKHFKFINAAELHTKQLLKLVQLLLEAEYPDGPPPEYHKFIVFATNSDKLQTIQPYINHTHVLMRESDIVGFIVVSTKHQIKEISNNISGWRQQDREVISCLDFYANGTQDSDFILQYIAIDEKYRGQGFFKVLKNYLTKLAKNSNCSRIVFMSQITNPALGIYKYYGAKVMNDAKFLNTIDNNNLVKLYFTL